MIILKLSKLMKFLTDGSNIRNEWHLKIKISDEIIRLYRTFLTAHSNLHNYIFLLRKGFNRQSTKII